MNFNNLVENRIIFGMDFRNGKLINDFKGMFLIGFILLLIIFIGVIFFVLLFI